MDLGYTTEQILIKNGMALMGQTQEVPVLIAFSAGLLSFFSPCVLPLIPSYITYITGVSFNDLKDSQAKARVRWTTSVHSFLFILGFSTIFMLMGASASYLGQLLSRYQYWIMKIGGVLIILMGIQFVLQIFPFLQIEKRFHMKQRPLGYIGSFVAGIVFAAGWTPCIGPILSTILIYASSTQRYTTGILLLGIYSLGLGIPFFLSALAFSMFLTAFEKIRKYMRIIIFVSGFFLIAIGILFLTDIFKDINAFFMELTGQ
jgi:cytochrome c-type biogenesis protein